MSATKREENEHSFSSSYRNLNHRVAAETLRHAHLTGRLGQGHQEHLHKNYDVFTAFFQTLPYKLLIFQFIWSATVTFIAYGVAPRGENSLSTAYWKSQLGVSSSISYGVGWALFVLLGFFIREASNRYWEALLNWQQLSALLIRIVRFLHQMYPQGFWHENDLDRIAAHLIAYPIALKMHLRGERDADQFSSFLAQADIQDILHSDYMHIHCMRVVRSYFAVAEDDAPNLFTMAAADKNPAGWGIRFVLIDVIEAVDRHADAILRIASFHPAAGYINHLYIFLYIWMFFLPLALVEVSGWFTVLWALLISYGVGMTHSIAMALNDPFGFDIQDIKLSALSTETALEVLNTHAEEKANLTAVIQRNHSTPTWLEEPAEEDLSLKSQEKFSIRRFPSLSLDRKTLTFLLWFGLFIAWGTFIVFILWAFRSEYNSSCRWWCVYIPIDNSITSYVSLSVFLLIGFWMDDAYGRYWRGLQLWHTDIRKGVEEIAFQFAIMCKPGLWHQRDRERLFSHLVAAPYAAAACLREDIDTTKLEKILSPQDLAALVEASNPFERVMTVISGYYNSIDNAPNPTCDTSTTPMDFTRYTTFYTIWGLESAVQECIAMSRFPPSKFFTSHIKFFTSIWLAMLPASLVSFNGFMSFLFFIPIGYSVIKLVKVGDDLADPFGFDRDDIPLDTFCEEIRNSLYSVYNSTLGGSRTYVHKSEYSREKFIPAARSLSSSNWDSDSAEHVKVKQRSHFQGWISENFINEPDSTSLVGSLRKFVSSLPSVSFWALALVTCWVVIAVMASYGLSFTWEEEKRDVCHAWCSPIDVDGDVLANIGFVLFLILGFRTADAMSRYEDGATYLFDLEMHLRNLAVEVMQSYKDGLFHEGDKERIVAHLVQIPLCFRDLILNPDQNPDLEEGLLSEEDRRTMKSNANPIDYLLQTVQAYLLLEDSFTREGHPEMLDYRAHTTLVYTMIDRVYKVRQIISRVLGMKRFPVVRSYMRHQHVFSALWLILLPLAMVPYTGFYTILWAPIISYGVLGLENIATQLVDPFGTDKTDIPVEQLCNKAAMSILEAVNTTKWDCEHHLTSVLSAAEPGLGISINGREIQYQYSLPQLEPFKQGVDIADDGWLKSGFLREERTKPKLFVHFVRSVPWWMLVGVTTWTVVATVISFVAKKDLEDDSPGGRWWTSTIALDTSVATYVSYAAFMLIAFYIQAAFSRYNDAGAVWGDNLRSACHSLASQFLALFPDGAIHEKDHERVIGHVAAIPIVLKNEMRDSRDLREIKGLLSNEDYCRVQQAENMTMYCVDVVRSYFFKVINYPDELKKPHIPGDRILLIKYEILALERIITKSSFLHGFEIAPGFVSLLNSLLAIWFILLPFALAESSGWFTILWVPIIAYGVLGMYSVAKELQFPFGKDLNDLDLDKMANSIVSDVLFVYKYYERGTDGLLHASDVQPYWKIETSTMKKVSFSKKRKSMFANVKTMVKLATNAITPITMGILVLWTVLMAIVAWLISRHFPFRSGIEESCDPWFCSRIAVNSSVKEYIGFALFLLLGSRLYDSHWRYVSAQKYWEEGILGFTRILAIRIFEGYDGNEWHAADLERIAGFLTSYSYAVAARLRGEKWEEKLREVLSDEDSRVVAGASVSSDYCIDVIFRYLAAGDRMERTEGVAHPAGSNIHWFLFFYLHHLKSTGPQCEQITRISFPYGYVTHLRIFMVIWLFLLPLGLVETSGWLSILWIVFICYGVVGIEKWAAELSDPFGDDLSDIPLMELTEKVRRIVRNNYAAYKDSARGFIKKDRQAFPASTLNDLQSQSV